MGKRSRRRQRQRKVMEMTTPLLLPPISRKVQLVREPRREYPELYLEIFVAGSTYEERQFADMFSRARCTKAKSPEEADLVIFTGGPDVWPGLYGEEPHETTKWDHERDNEDLKLFNLCEEQGIPMFGVCRGAQFLHVAKGGKLYQDVNHHYGDHQVYLLEEKRILHKVSSVHHQMCIKNDEMVVLADSGKANERWSNPTTCDRMVHTDIEAFFYREGCILGVQGHPEYRGYEEFAIWCLEQINQYIVGNPDITRKGRYLRVNPDLRGLKEAIEIVTENV